MDYDWLRIEEGPEVGHLEGSLVVVVQAVGGLAILFFGGNVLVRGASSLASRLGVSRLAIGLTVVAFGTSMPELAVSVDAAVSGAGDLSLGNVVGSNIVEAALESSSTVLDLGCGTGQPIAKHLASLGHRVVGVDASAEMLAFARARLPKHRWVHERMETVEFDETFDAVICWDSLFHLPRHEHSTVIRNIHRWLRPGGRLMISSGGLVGDTGFTDVMFGREFYYDSLSPASMTQLLEDTGFDLVISEMCDQPDGGRNRGKWATIGSRRA